ncbi:YraN family protein [Lentisalinibacter salinarum]|uniref:YraN family protein n=1 Tax=Lentisalinibacter salinarum TaxID=2992239 RepID=UPI00386E52AC
MGRTGRQRLGDGAEGLARRHLENAGLDCVAANYRCRLGELDLLMRTGNTLVVVEVRYRGAGARCSARDSVSPSKQRRIVRAAEQFLCRHPRYAEMEFRFDVSADGRPRLQWLQDAFRPW